jgi:hypothetical protein
VAGLSRESKVFGLIKFTVSGYHPHAVESSGLPRRSFPSKPAIEFDDIVFQLKLGDLTLKELGLGSQLLAGGGAFLSCSGTGLSDLGYLLDSLIDLDNSGSLFLGGGGDLAYQCNRQPGTRSLVLKTHVILVISCNRFCNIQ